MKLTSKYNIIRQAKYYLLGLALAGAVAGCEKDPVTPEPTPTPTPTPTTQKHNKILVFDATGQQISFDTVRYYLNQPDIDSVLMQSADSTMCCHLSPDAAQNVVGFLQQRCDIDSRVAGTGPFLFASNAYQETVNQALAQGFKARYVNSK